MSAPTWTDGTEAVTSSAQQTSAGGDTARALLQTLWRADRRLTATGLFLLALIVPTAAGIFLDDRVITGAPAWLKPTKFAISTSVYALTVAWVFSCLPGWPRLRRVISPLTAYVLLFEIAVIYLQAARGTTSHFNVATPFDAVVFMAMGLAILTMALATIAVAAALWRERFADPAMGWALRLGMTLTIVGSLTGALMTTGPTQAQLTEARASGHLATTGAHTVGGPDGSSGLPVTGWSTRHGDVRVPHFVGLHAVQILPLVALVTRRRSSKTRVRLTVGAAAALAGIYLFTLVQALSGAPLVAIAS